jgi:hypothetical protein
MKSKFFRVIAQQAAWLSAFAAYNFWLLQIANKVAGQVC